MFLDILKREDVHDFLLEITIDETRFSKKEIPYMICEEKISVTEYNLFTLLDALFKYSIIIDDLTYFDEFLKDVHKILKTKIKEYNGIKGLVKFIIQSSDFKSVFNNGCYLTLLKIYNNVKAI